MVKGRQAIIKSVKKTIFTSRIIKLLNSYVYISVNQILIHFNSNVDIFRMILIVLVIIGSTSMMEVARKFHLIRCATHYLYVIVVMDVKSKLVVNAMIMIMLTAVLE